MKKFLFLLLYFLLAGQLVSAKNYSKGDIVTGTFSPVKRLKIELSPGDWQVVYKSSDLIYGITARGVGIVKVENGEVTEAIEVEYIQTGGQYITTIGGIAIEIFYKNQYGGCYDRPDNYLVEFFRKGNSHNCLIVGHFDLPKRLTNPDDPERRGLAAQYNQWIRSSGVKIPKIVIYSQHLYFSQMAGGNFYNVSHFINPTVLNAPVSKFSTIDASEYSKFNIEKHPEHQKVMDEWVSIAAKKHIKFEKDIKAKPNHYLNLSKYVSGENETEQSVDTSIVDQIKKLNELYKSGALTKEEFEKAKKKLLN